MDQFTIKLVNAAVSYLPRRVISYIVGKPSLEELGNKESSRLKSRGLKNPPNFNKLLPVDGVEDGKVRWFTEVEDRKPEDPVMIFFHGGGYSLGLMPLQASTLMALHRLVPKSLRLSIVWLDYTVSTVEPFPQQLIEAANTYSAVQASCNNIILIGDSAGGNLAVNLMRHIHTPFDRVPPVLHPENKPTAALLVSPWLQLHIDLPLNKESSYVKYDSHDYINAHSLNKSGNVVLREKEWPGCRKLFAETYKDTSIPWDEVLPKNGRVLITTGEVEILRDSIEEFYEISGLRNSGGQLYIEPGAVHDTPAILGPRKSKITAELVNYLKGLVAVTQSKL